MNIAVMATTPIRSGHIGRIVEGIRQCACEMGARVFVFTCEKDYVRGNRHHQGEYDIFKLPDFTRFDGVILSNSSIFSAKALEEIAEKIERAGIPAVSVGGVRENMYNFTMDNEKAMAGMVEHMINIHGCRNLFYVSGPLESEEAVMRLKAYKNVLKTCGIPYDREKVYVGNYLYSGGEQAALHWLEKGGELPDAIVCANDLMAVGVIQVLTARGISVPEQVAVTGFDDDLGSESRVPGLTSIARHEEEEGYLACRRLLSGIKKEEYGTCEGIQYELICRESCGCAANEAIDNMTFRKLHFEKEYKNEQYVCVTKEMANDLLEVDSFKKFKAVLKRYVIKANCKSFYLFLREELLLEKAEEDWKEEESGEEGGDVYKPRHELFLGFENGAFLQHKKPHVWDNLYDFDSWCAGNRVYTVSPVHFNCRSFGFCVMNGELAFETPLFFNWMQNIGNALENIRKQRALRAMIKKLNTMWCYDMLSGLLNRAGFFKEGRIIWDECRRNGEQALLVFMDLDGLKAVNDCHGHDEGDRFIEIFACILRKQAKRAGGKQISGRYGGDEFVMLEANANQERGEEYVKEIKALMEVQNKNSGLPYSIEASLGWVIATPREGLWLEAVIEEADREMYRMKKLHHKRTRS